MKTPGRIFYEEQLAFLQRGDVDGLLRAHYREDAVLVNLNAIVRGHAALKPYFESYLKMLGKFSAEITGFTETEDGILWEASMSSNFGKTRVYDAFALAHGKITHHFAGVMTP